MVRFVQTYKAITDVLCGIGDFIITLDHRNLKTPGGTKLAVPQSRRLAAMLIANEWENQDEVLKQHALPVVRGSCKPRCLR